MSRFAPTSATKSEVEAALENQLAACSAAQQERLESIDTLLTRIPIERQVPPRQGPGC
jgi:hypothetical protein